jgi:hypothetical protein
MECLNWSDLVIYLVLGGLVGWSLATWLNKRDQRHDAAFLHLQCGRLEAWRLRKRDSRFANSED